MRTGQELPPRNVIARTLHSVTERLAREFAHPSDVAPAWNRFDWDIARAVSALHGISVVLANRLRWRGPTRWQEFLCEQREQGLLRERRVDQLLCAIDEGARREGIALIALKGSALRKTGLYAPGERPMGDIDLLAAPTDCDASSRILQSVGYRHGGKTRRHEIYITGTSPLAGTYAERHENPMNIEVHFHIAEPLPLSEVDITPLLLGGKRFPGINAYPDDAALLTHLLLHSAGSISTHSLRLIQLEDIARLAARFTAHDEIRLDSIPGVVGPAWWALPPLRMSERYCGARIPPGLMHALEPSCPRLLRRSAGRCSLTSVSWSNLRIAVFPALTWARSGLETCRYAWSRVMPSQVLRLELIDATRRQPHIACIPWYRLSQRQRAFRWILGRATRVQTIASVQAALASGGSSRLS